MIACGNHLSAFDPFGYGHLLQAGGIAPRFLAKDVLFRIPLLGILLRAARQIPVRRGTSRSSDALADARAALERGELIMLFPRGHVHPGPRAVAHAGSDRRRPARPRDRSAAVADRDLGRACAVARSGSPVPRPGPGRRVQMLVGEPFTVSMLDGETNA